MKAYFVYHAYDDYYSYGKTPVKVFSDKEKANNFCVEMNKKDFSYIEEDSVYNNTDEYTSGYFFEEIELILD